MTFKDFYHSVKSKVKDTAIRAVRGISKRRGLVGVLAGTLAVGAAANTAKPDVVDLTSVEPLLSTTSPPTTQVLYNLGDFTVNGKTPDRLAGLGFGKSTYHAITGEYIGTSIIGFAKQESGFPSYLIGRQNGDPSTTEPLDNIFCLVLNEKPSGNPQEELGIMGYWDKNLNGKWGTYNTSTGEIIPEDGEFFYSHNDFKIDGVQGNVGALPAYEDISSSQIPEVDMIPEPATLALLLLGAGGMAVRRRRKR